MLALLVSIACLALNAFFVAAEFAIVKVRITQLRPRVRRGERRALAAEAVLSRLDRYLSVTQVGITVASLGLGWVGEPAMERAGDHVAVLLTGAPLGSGGHIAVSAFGLALLTFLHVLVGELVPKAIAIRHSESTVLVAALPLRFADGLFRPALWILERAQTAVLRALHVDPEMTEGSLSEEEIVGILAANASRGSRRAADKRRTIERVLRFAARPVRSIMVPRVDAVALPIDTPGERALELLRKHEFSRVPLYDGSMDEIAGYLYAKDFLFDDAARARPNLRGLERKTLFVPESTNGLGVLREMQRSHVPLAIVVDEYGGTSGIVTFEDLVEEVFGDLRDELDAEPEKVVARGDAWEVDARATVDDLREAGVPIDEHAPSEPIGKLVLDRLGHLPHVGDVASLADGVIAQIVAISKRRIQRVRVSMG
jgi:CBS domain containing-hemolysin-like protein